MKGTSRSFWSLVILALVLGGAMVVLSLRAGATQLGCWWAPAQRFAYQGGTCGEPIWPLGYRAWLGAVVIVALAVASVLTGAIGLLRRTIRTHRAWVALAERQVAPPAAVLRAASSVALQVPKVLRDDRAYCFCRGLLHPQVVVSTAMVAELDPEELAAVFAHEGAHVARRDPLRALLAHCVASGLFFLPVMADLARGEREGAELGADAMAVALVGRRPLVGALKVALGARRPILGSVAEIASLDALDLRIEALVHPRAQRVKLRPRAVVFSLVCVGALGVIVALGPLRAPARVIVPMSHPAPSHVVAPMIIGPNSHVVPAN